MQEVLRKKKNELEKKKQKEEESKLPLGIDGWKVYCKNNGLDLTSILSKASILIRWT